MADVLDMIQNTLVNIYERRVNIGREAIGDMMKADTWIPAADALEMGFADTIDGEIGIAAKLTGYEKYFKTLPVEPNDVMLRIGEMKSIKDLDRFLRDVGNLSRKATTALIAQSKVILPSDPGEPTDENGQLLLDALNRVKVPTA